MFDVEVVGSVGPGGAGLVESEIHGKASIAIEDLSWVQTAVGVKGVL